MDWNDLRLLLAVGRTRSFSAAGRALGLTQPTVGRRIGALERRLGAVLLDRGPTGHDLTPLGAMLVAAAARMEDAAVAAERRVAGHDLRPEGVVRVTTVSILATEILVPAAARIAARHPGLTLDVVSEGRPLDLARREADIALRPMPFVDPDILARKVGEMAHGIYAAAGYDPGAGPVGLLLPGEAQWNLAEIAWMIGRYPGARVVLRSDQRTVLLRAARDGLGLACLPLFVGDATAGLERVVAGRGPGPALWLGLHRDLARVRRIRTAADLIAEELAARRSQLEGGA